MIRQVKKADLCKHDNLHFENGGLHLVCDCGYAWLAVGKHPMRIIQDVMARGMGFTEMDKRTNPMALVKATVSKPIAKFKPLPQRPSEQLIAAVRLGVPTPEDERRLRSPTITLKPKSMMVKPTKTSKKSS